MSTLPTMSGAPHDVEKNEYGTKVHDHEGSSIQGAGDAGHMHRTLK
jgi:hypothetical protein